MEIKGTAHIVGAEIVKSEKFKFRELVIKTEGQYPQYISIQFSNSKCDLLNNVRTGSQVTVGINIKGSEYNGKYYNKIEGWKIIDVVGCVKEPQTTTQNQDDDENNLPF